MQHLTLEISDQQHQYISAIAAAQGKSLDVYAVEQLFALEKSDEERAIRALNDLLVARIQEAEQGSTSTQSIKEIFAQAREDANI